MKVLGVDPGIAGAVAIIEIDVEGTIPKLIDAFRSWAPPRKRASTRSAYAPGSRPTIPILRASNVRGSMPPAGRRVRIQVRQSGRGDRSRRRVLRGPPDKSYRTAAAWHEPGSAGIANSSKPHSPVSTVPCSSG